jgi:hypothetical protein
LERNLQISLGDNDYGSDVRSLAFMAVSVFESEFENRDLVSDFSKAGYFKDPRSGERVKYLSIAFAIAPSEAICGKGVALQSLFLARLLVALKGSKFQAIKGFKAKNLVADIELEMEKIRMFGATQ